MERTKRSSQEDQPKEYALAHVLEFVVFGLGCRIFLNLLLYRAALSAPYKTQKKKNNPPFKKKQKLTNKKKTFTLQACHPRATGRHWQQSSRIQNKVQKSNAASPKKTTHNARTCVFRARGLLGSSFPSAH